MNQEVNFDFDIGDVTGRQGPQGETGPTGTGIQSITLISTEGLNKTYRVTYTDGGTFDYVVHDGSGISGASFDQEAYTLTLTFEDGTRFTTGSIRGPQGEQGIQGIQGPQGERGPKGDIGIGIQRIEKTATSGLVDTYTVTYTNGGTYTYTVTNGKDGEDSAVLSVAGKTGNVTLDAGDVEYDGTETYNAGTIGAELSDLNDEISDSTTGLDSKAPVIIETASGAIASFSDGADSMPIKKLVANIEPVQDLHGYANPWPGGGGKNKAAGFDNQTYGGITLTTNSSGEVVTNGTATYEITHTGINFSADAGDYYLSGCADGGNLTTTYDMFMWDITTNSRPKRWDGTTAISSVFDSSTSEQVKIEDGHTYSLRIRFRNGYVANNVVFKPMLRLSTETDPTFAPYSNICPISGWTGANVEQRGKNLLKYPYENTSLTSNGITWTANSDGTITANGTATGDSYFNLFTHINISSIGMEELRGKVIKLKAIDAPTGVKLTFTGRLVVGAPGYTVAVSEAGNEAQGTVFDGTKTIYIAFMAISGTTLNNVVLKPMLTLASDEITDYEPYAPQSLSVTFPSSAGTVYGGTLTLNPDRTGTLVVDHVCKTFSTQNLSFSYVSGASDNTSSYFNITNAFTGTPIVADATMRSDILPYVNNLYVNRAVEGVTGQGVYGSIRVNADRLSEQTADGIKAWLPETWQMYATLVSPIIYQLTASEISAILTTLYGTNNVWSDVGSVVCTYACDSRLYIDNKIAEAVANALNA